MSGKITAAMLYLLAGLSFHQAFDGVGYGDCPYADGTPVFSPAEKIVFGTVTWPLSFLLAAADLGAYCGETAKLPKS